MFALNNTLAKLDSLNTRTEKHGDQNVPACDLRFTAHVSNKILDHFHPHLREVLYRQGAQSSGQQSLPIEHADGLTEIELPNLKPLRFEDEFPGYSLGMTEGLECSDVHRIDPVKLSKFELEAMSGGTVRVSFSAAMKPTDAQLVWLYARQQTSMQITITPPEHGQEASPQVDLVFEDDEQEPSTADAAAEAIAADS